MVLVKPSKKEKEIIAEIDKVTNTPTAKLIFFLFISYAIIHMLGLSLEEDSGIVLFFIILPTLYLLTQKWFWYVLLLLSCMGSFFAMIASVIHFQILGAVGFAVLTAVLYLLLQVYFISPVYEPEKKQEKPEKNNTEEFSTKEPYTAEETYTTEEPYDDEEIE